MSSVFKQLKKRENQARLHKFNESLAIGEMEDPALDVVRKRLKKTQEELGDSDIESE
jgi:polysaccharide deacetylase 2 family uncharacterized protein YibQ